MRVTKSDVRASIVFAVLAFLSGILLAHSTNKWIDSMERGSEELALAKKELLASAGLLPLHHAVYAKVGEDRWERQVKPEFLSSITQAAARDAGDPLPTWRVVVDWVRSHPDEARRMLENAAAPR